MTNEKNSACACAICACATTVLTGAVYAGTATFEGLGHLRGGETGSEAIAVSADGLVVVGTAASPEASEGVAFRWTAASGMTSLFGPPFDSAVSMVANDVTPDGTFIIGAANVPGEGFQVFRWSEADGLEDLNTIPSYFVRQTTQGTIAYATTSDGHTIVGRGELYLPGIGADLQSKAAIWNDTIKSWSLLPRLNTGNDSDGVLDITPGGSLAVGYSDSNLGRDAVVWTTDGVFMLGALPGIVHKAEAHAISSNGNVIVGHSQTTQLFTDGFYWTPSLGMVQIDDPPLGATKVFARGVADKGRSIVGHAEIGPLSPIERAFIWDPDHGSRWLDDVLTDEHEVDLTGWFLHTAEDVSPDGRIIVGRATNPLGDEEAYRIVFDTWDASSIAEGPKPNGTFTEPPGEHVLVDVGDAGNPASPFGGFGDVAVPIRAGRTEVTNAQYAAFLNAMARTSDPGNLYNPVMATDPRGGILRTGLYDDVQYLVKPGYENKPVNFMSWWDAVRLCNWLQNGQPIDVAQDDTSTEDGAYTLQGLTTSPPILGDHGITRNEDADYFVPTLDEWHKAAYYDPEDPGADAGSSLNYWTYATRSDTPPITASATLDGDIAEPGTNVANYDFAADWDGQDGHVTSVASAGSASQSHYGTFDQEGNVREWCEDRATFTIAMIERAAPGGSWRSPAGDLGAQFPGFPAPELELDDLGFRVFAAEPALPADLTGDGVVGPADLAQLLGAWGRCGDPQACPEDLDDDGVVGPADLASLLGSWGSSGLHLFVAWVAWSE